MATNFELIDEIDKRDNDFEEIDEFMPTERLPNAPKPVVRRGKEKSYMIKRIRYKQRVINVFG